MTLPDLPPHLADEGFEARGIDAFRPEEIVAFVDAILCGECQMDARAQLERSIAKYFQDYTEDKRFILALVAADGRLCGFTAIDRYNDRTATLKWIFVSADYRGLGIGSWLLDAALEFARKVGYEKAILCTATQMEAAHELYRSRGFEFKQWVTFWRQRMQVYENDLSKSVEAVAPLSPTDRAGERKSERAGEKVRT